MKKYLAPGFWAAFLGLSIFNAYMHISFETYMWLPLDAFCLFWFSRNLSRALEASRSE